MTCKYRNRINTLLIVFALIFTLAGSAKSQGMYLKRGQSSQGFGLSFNVGDNIIGAALTVGFSHQAIIDFNIGLGFVRDLDAKNTSPHGSAGAVLHPLKQNNIAPISIDLAASYTVATSIGDGGDNKIAAFGASLFRDFSLKGGARIIPEAGIIYSKNSDNSNSYFNDDDSFYTYFFSLHFLPQTSTAKLAVFTPNVSYSEDNFVVGVTASFFTLKPGE